MSMKEAVKFGEMSLSGKDIALPSIKYDRMAIGNRGELYLVSMVAETQMVKAARAILCGGAKAHIQASRGKVRKPSAESWVEARNPGNLYPTPEGYNVYTQKLNYGLAHALFVTRTPGFMKVVSDEALWQELNDTRFTTPLLREWLPYIEEQLREQGLLEDADVFNAACGVLTVTTESLDEIVSKGIKEGKLRLGNVRPKVGLTEAPEPAPPRQFKDGDLVTWTDPKGIQRSGEVRFDQRGDEVSIRYFPATLPGQMPIAKVTEVPAADLEYASFHQPNPAESEPEPVPAGPKSWKVAARVRGETGPNYNGCRYSTKEKAQAAGESLFMRWTMMEGYEVEPSDDEPNY